MVKMKNQTILQSRNRAEKEYHSLSRRFCQLIVVISVVIIQFGSYQNSQAQDFWERITIPTNRHFASLDVNVNGDIYLGAFKTPDTGGVYRSTDGGESWELIGLDNKSVYALSFNNEGNLLAGVGNGAGIHLYYIDQGTWEKVFNSNGNTGVLVPGYNDIIFSGSAAINRSDDDGHTWEQIVNMDCDPYDFTVFSPDTVFVAMTEHFGGGQAAVYRSIDGGDTWHTFGLKYHYGRAVANTSNGDLFAGCTGHHYYGWGGIFRLEPGSESWDTLSRGPRVMTMVVTDEDVIFCGYISSIESVGGVLRSSDYGESWFLDTAGMGYVGIRQLVLDKNETLFALSNSFPSKLYKSVLPVNVIRHVVSSKESHSYCSPNPFKDKTKIYFDKPEYPNKLTLTIFSILGRKKVTIKMSADNVSQGNIEIDKVSLSPGINVYKITGSNYFSSGKFVVTK